MKMEGMGTKERISSEILLPHYRLGKRLGVGSFAKVKLARHVLTGKKVAVKILDLQKMGDLDVEKVRREIKILGAFAHPHILRLYEVIEVKSKIYMVMEYMNCGELFDYIVQKGRLQEDEARFIFQQIISGVECCHLHMVAHRDLKPENLLLDSNGTVKIADFGLSNVMHDGHFLKTTCGSPNYAAPEVLSVKLYAGPEVDVWSCGVTLYAILCGSLPFDSDNLPGLYNQIKSGIYTLPSHLSPGARDLISQMLVVDPMKRITIPKIRQHPWFLHHIPRYLAVPAVDIMQRTKKINEVILQEVITFGFKRERVLDSLRKRMQNEATVTYYLLLDNWVRVSKAYLKSGFEELIDGLHSNLDTEQCCTSSSHQRGGTSLISRNSVQPQHDMENQGMSPSFQFPIGRSWTLGIKSPAHPRAIMTNVLGALQRLNVRWKKNGHYNMKCQWVPSFSGNPRTTPPLDINHVPTDDPAIFDIDGVGLRSQNCVKFEMQLYKTTEDGYILDLQRVHGPPLLFLQISAAFFTQLRII